MDFKFFFDEEIYYKLNTSTLDYIERCFHCIFKDSKLSYDNDNENYIYTLKGGIESKFQLQNQINSVINPMSNPFEKQFLRDYKLEFSDDFSSAELKQKTQRININKQEFVNFYEEFVPWMSINGFNYNSENSTIGYFDLEPEKRYELDKMRQEFVEHEKQWGKLEESIFGDRNIFDEKLKLVEGVSKFLPEIEEPIELCYIYDFIDVITQYHTTRRKAILTHLKQVNPSEITDDFQLRLEQYKRDNSNKDE